MQYTVITNEYGITSLKVSSPDRETLEYDVMSFFKDQTHIKTLYHHIDLYLKGLSKEAQLELYSLFYDTYIKEDSTNYGDRVIVRELEGKIKRACELLDLDRWRGWFVQFQHQLLIPESVSSTFTFDPDMGITKEKTYILSEYVDLVGLIVFIRTLSPLYIEFFTYVKQTSNHPYYLLFRLFIDSAIQVCPELDKLRTYIEVNQETLIGTGKNEHLIIGAGLSDDDSLDYLVAEVVFNKLLTIDFFHKKCNVVSFIFQTIRYKGNFVTSESSNIRTKSSRGDPNREDYSYFEDYRKATAIPLGTIVEIQDSLADPAMLARDLGFVNFDFNRYQYELETNLVPMTRQPIEPVRIYVLGWLLSKTINPRALFHLENRKVIELLLFAKVALLNTNMNIIGLLLGSVRAPDAKFVNIVIRNTLDRALLNDLKEHYHFAMETDKLSTIEKTITEVGKEIVNSIWVPVGIPPELSHLVTKEGILEIPSNINNVICGYVKGTLVGFEYNS